MPQKKIKKIKKNNKATSNIIEEVDNILSSTNTNCCMQFNVLPRYSVYGANNILKIFDFTYLIPNLFRKCYAYNTVPIPNVCVNFINNGSNSKFLPFLLDENIIKSLLYFNFPVNIKYHDDIDNNISNVINFKNIISKNIKGTTYGSITPSYILYNYVYSANSMLSNLLTFNRTMINESNINMNQQTTCSYTVPWDYTTGCFETDKIYIVCIANNNDIITQTTFSTLNYIRYTYFNNFNYNNINYDEILLVYKSNIYKILDYAQEVYTDILQIYYNVVMDCNYCMKDYMNVENIPNLIKLYNNFRKNQLYSYANSLPNSSIVDLVPMTTTLPILFARFTLYYTQNPKLGRILNIVTLSVNEGIVICYNQNSNNLTNIKQSNYSYYYLNVNNSASVQLYNYWGITGSVPIYTTAGTLPNDGNKYNNTFITDFLGGTSGIAGTTGAYNIKSYLSIVNCLSYSYETTISLGGAYDVIYAYPRSLNYNGSTYCNGQIYYIYNDLAKKSLNSKVYLTFETYGNGSTAGVPNTPYGIGLPIVFYPLNSAPIVNPP